MLFKDYREFTFYKQHMEHMEIEEVDESWALQLISESEMEQDTKSNSKTIRKRVKKAFASEFAERIAPHVATLKEHSSSTDSVPELKLEQSDAVNDEVIEVCPSILSLTAIEQQLIESAQLRSEELPYADTLQSALAAKGALKSSFWRRLFS